MNAELFTLAIHMLAAIFLLALFIAGTYRTSKWAKHSAKTLPTIVAGNFIYMFLPQLGVMLVAGGYLVLWTLYLAYYINKENKTTFDLGKLVAFFLYLLSSLIGILLRTEWNLLQLILSLLCIVILGVSYLLSKRPVQ